MKIHHVFAGNASSADLKALKDLRTVHGGRIKIDASKGLRVDNAMVIKPDMGASNGVIHVVDTVMMPR